MKNKSFVIYLHTSPSGKSYVGQTCNYEKRCRDHQLTTGCTRFSSAVKKYGWENFKHEILEKELSHDEANQKEIFWIAKLNTLHPNGYNLDTGGGGRGIPTQETRKRMSAASKGHERNIGVVLSEQARKNMSLAAMGKAPTTLGLIHTEEAKAAQSLSKIGNKHCVGRVMNETTRKALDENPSFGFLGKKHSEETKKLMSEKAKLAHAKRKQEDLFKELR